jgi:hypothetical protein
MTTDQLIKLLASVTLVESMVSIGLGVAFADVSSPGAAWDGGVNSSRGPRRR